jgi:hypothetical protein
MAIWNGKSNATETARPERRASKRLAADLLRFEKAFEQLEQAHEGLGACADEPVEATPIATRDVQDYLNCLDEAIKQLAEEFAEDTTVAKLTRQRDANEADSSIAAAMFANGSASTTVAATSAGPRMPRPNCDAFDGRPCDAAAATLAFSQVDTSAI